MILIPDFVPPAPEAAARIDPHVLQLGEELFKNAFAFKAGGRVAVVEAAVVGGDDLVGGLQHFGVDEAADAVFQESFVVDRFQRGFGDFEHYGPIRAGFGGGAGLLLAGGKLEGGEVGFGGRLVVGRVVGKDGSAVEGAVVFGEVELELGD